MFDIDENIGRETCTDFGCYEEIVAKFARITKVSQEKTYKTLPSLTEKLSSLVITWNVEGHSPKKQEDLKGLFEPVLENRPDLIVIGLEEVFECKWHNSIKIASNSKESEEFKNWEKILTSTLKEIDSSYRFITTESNGALMLIFFSNISEIELKPITTKRTNLGLFFGTMANKSAITLNLSIRDINLQFVACHLDSGQGDNKNKDRISQLHTILPTIVDTQEDEQNVELEVRKK